MSKHYVIMDRVGPMLEPCIIDRLIDNSVDRLRASLIVCV